MDIDTLDKTSINCILHQACFQKWSLSKSTSVIWSDFIETTLLCESNFVHGEEGGEALLVAGDGAEQRQKSRKLSG